MTKFDPLLMTTPDPSGITRTATDEPSVVTDLDAIDVDADATGELWREHSSMLLRFATVLVGPTDAHDVATEALLTASDRLLADDVDHPTSFLYRAVSNRAHDLRRSNERRWRRDLHAVGPAASPDRDAQSQDSLVDVRRAVSSLSLAQRSVVYFVYWEDRTERDTAEILGIAPGTVRRHLVRARTHLAKALR